MGPGHVDFEPNKRVDSGAKAAAQRDEPLDPRILIPWLERNKTWERDFRIGIDMPILVSWVLRRKRAYWGRKLPQFFRGTGWLCRVRCGNVPKRKRQLMVAPWEHRVKARQLVVGQSAGSWLPPEFIYTPPDRALSLRRRFPILLIYDLQCAGFASEGPLSEAGSSSKVSDAGRTRKGRHGLILAITYSLKPKNSTAKSPSPRERKCAGAHDQIKPRHEAKTSVLASTLTKRLARNTSGWNGYGTALEEGVGDDVGMFNKL
ncbi:hypothetical protein DFH09DRAFT_1289370 [Mycena vulgaris]|nr:hypothetical protein DFH09DRAFT_1289370 [Mycena vulgaris]